MALVRAVMAASTFDSSMLSVSSRTSTNTGTPPRSTKALALETKVNEGMMISSPGPVPARIAAISRAPVHECVSSALREPMVRSSQAWQRLVNGPSPERCMFSCACRMYSSSRPVRNGLLNGTWVIGASGTAANGNPCQDQAHGHDAGCRDRLAEEIDSAHHDGHHGQPDVQRKGERQRRSEERRVGKECRTWWSPNH